jgi:rubrerythrin
MSLDVLVILCMALGLVVFVGEPLVRQTANSGWHSEDTPEMERLSLQKETLYTAIRDLDFDFQTDKVDEKDYAELRHHLEDEALQILRQIDDVDPLAMLDVELERQILALRQHRASRTRLSQGTCSGCGAILRGDENFCPSCGQSSTSL